MIPSSDEWSSGRTCSVLAIFLLNPMIAKRLYLHHRPTLGKRMVELVQRPPFDLG